MSIDSEIPIKSPYNHSLSSKLNATLLPQFGVIFLCLLEIIDPFVCLIPLWLIKETHYFHLCNGWRKDIKLCFEFPLDYRISVLPVNLAIDLIVACIISSSVGYELPILKYFRVKLIELIRSRRLTLLKKRSDFPWFSGWLEIVDLAFQAVFLVDDFELTHEPEGFLWGDCTVHLANC